MGKELKEVREMTCEQNQNTNRDVEITKKKRTEILELKGTITKRKIP